MLIQTIRAIWNRNCYLIIDTYFDIIFMIKLISAIDVFGIQSGLNSLKSSELVDLFTRSPAFINTKVLLNSYKKRARGNWDQSKHGSDMFKVDKSNANIEKNDSIILNSNYDSNSMWKIICPVVLSYCWVK